MSQNDPYYAANEGDADEPLCRACGCDCEACGVNTTLIEASERLLRLLESGLLIQARPELLTFAKDLLGEHLPGEPDPDIAFARAAVARAQAVPA